MSDRRKNTAVGSERPAAQEKPTGPINVIELKDLPPIASNPIQVHAQCSRCGHSGTVHVRQEYTPIPESFRPFYERALRGDLAALIEYYKERGWHSADLAHIIHEG